MKPYWPPSRQLLPVHLQASDAHVEALLHLRTAAVLDAGPGVLDMKTDDAAWQRGVVSFRTLSAILPSGHWFSAAEPVTREGATLPAGASSLFLAVPKEVLRGPNVAPLGSPLHAVRFASTGAPEMPWLTPRAALVTRAELTNDVEVVRLGRIERAGTRLQWQAGSMPTAARVRGSATLKAGLDRLLAAVATRKQDLLRYRADHPFRLSDVALDALPGLHLLSILQRHAPLLADLAARSAVPPRELYRALAELYGALSAFAGEDARVPAYAHDNLAESFPWLFREIAKLVDEAARDRTTALPFKRQDASTFVLTFDRAALVGKRPFLVGSGAEEAFLRDRVPSLLKMASPQGMAPLLQSALRGVAVAVEFEPSPAIPRRPDVVTYRINTRDRLWLDIEDRCSIVLNLTNAPPGLGFTLYGVERAV